MPKRAAVQGNGVSVLTVNGRGRFLFHASSTLEDEGLPAQVDHRSVFLRMEIMDVYRGSRRDDTCLTEIRLFSAHTSITTDIYSEGGVIRYDNSNAPPRRALRPS